MRKNYEKSDESEHPAPTLPYIDDFYRATLTKIEKHCTKKLKTDDIISSMNDVIHSAKQSPNEVEEFSKMELAVIVALVLVVAMILAGIIAYVVGLRSARAHKESKNRRNRQDMRDKKLSRYTDDPKSGQVTHKRGAPRHVGNDKGVGDKSDRPQVRPDVYSSVLDIMNISTTANNLASIPSRLHTKGAMKMRQWITKVLEPYLKENEKALKDPLDAAHNYVKMISNLAEMLKSVPQNKMVLWNMETPWLSGSAKWKAPIRFFNLDNNHGNAAITTDKIKVSDETKFNLRLSAKAVAELERYVNKKCKIESKDVIMKNGKQLSPWDQFVLPLVGIQQIVNYAYAQLKAKQIKTLFTQHISKHQMIDFIENNAQSPITCYERDGRVPSQVYDSVGKKVMTMSEFHRIMTQKDEDRIHGEAIESAPVAKAEAQPKVVVTKSISLEEKRAKRKAQKERRKAKKAQVKKEATVEPTEAPQAKVEEKTPEEPKQKESPIPKAPPATPKARVPPTKLSGQLKTKVGEQVKRDKKTKRESSSPGHFALDDKIAKSVIRVEVSGEMSSGFLIRKPNMFVMSRHGIPDGVDIAVNKPFKFDCMTLWQNGGFVEIKDLKLTCKYVGSGGIDDDFVAFAPGQLANKLMMQFSIDYDAPKNANVCLIGFNANKGGSWECTMGIVQKPQTSKTAAKGDSEIEYTADTAAGFSGCPAVAHTGQQYVVVALHTRGFGSSDLKKHNRGIPSCVLREKLKHLN